jgi:hypothetical protein
MVLFFLSWCSCAQEYDFFGFTIRPNFPVEEIDHGFWRQYRLCHPKFNWSLPHGISKSQLPLLWAQPENHRHFHDTNVSDHCGVVQVIHNGTIENPLLPLSNVTHFINAKPTANQTRSPRYDALLVLTGHWGSYFQHFFDNIGPQLSLALDVIGRRPQDLAVVVETSDLFPNVPLLWRRLGFSRVVTGRPVTYSATTLIVVESAPRVHPHFFTHLRQLLRLSKPGPRKVIVASRRLSNIYYQQRVILNEDAVINVLADQFGAGNVVVFDHQDFDLDETIDLFATAKLIVGSHGGSLYNQFFAPRSAKVLEIMPVQKDGRYFGQGSVDDEPPFSHLAVWSNTLLIGQSFWRYYQLAGEAHYSVDVARFRKFVKAMAAEADEDL